MISFKSAHFPPEIILTCVRWYLAYPLSYRHVEELMEERGVSVDHATIPPPHAAGGEELAHGRDVHPGQRQVALPLSGRR